MWTDTHLHLDAAEYQGDQEAVVKRARALHVNRFVIPAVHAKYFDAVKALAHATPGAVYCLGIHPLLVAQSTPEDLEVLKDHVHASLADPLFAGIGEIGLDGFVPNPDWAQQTHFFHTQLKLARDLGCPVVLHVRRSQDQVLKGLRRFEPPSGLAHAFNGSLQQANMFVQLNMGLGFGGACTYTRALQIRRLAQSVPDTHLVLETDGPDISPEWIAKDRNEPAHIPRIAEVVAELRGIELDALSALTERNAERFLPALGKVITLG